MHVCISVEVERRKRRKRSEAKRGSVLDELGSLSGAIFDARRVTARTSRLLEMTHFEHFCVQMFQSRQSWPSFNQC